MTAQRDFANYVEAELQHIPPLRPEVLEVTFELIAGSGQRRRHGPRAQSPTGRFGSMFSATKFVVAGAIVALFNGFLLAGLLTRPSEEAVPAAASPSPTATAARIPDWRSTVVTEDVAPGIVRVVGDGAGHDFEPEVVGLDPDQPERVQAARGFDEIAIDPAGEVWLHRPTGDLIRVGRPGSRPGPALWQDGGLEWLDVAPDGSVLAFDRTSGPHLRRLSEDGASGASGSGTIRRALLSRWTWYDGFQGVESLVSVAPDASWEGPDIGSLFDELQSAVKDPEFRAYPQEVWDRVSRNFGPVCDMAMTSDGSVWAGLCGDGGHGFGHGGLARMHDGVWQAAEPLAGTPDEDILVSDATLVEAGLDGTLWVLAFTNTPDGILIAINGASGGRVELPERLKGRPLDERPIVGQVLFRFDGEGWASFPWSDVAGGEVATGRGAGLGVVDHEGRFWMGAGSETSQGWSTLLSFDGHSTGSHGSVGPVRDLALHPDGSVWVAAADGLFVIDPVVAHHEDATTELVAAAVDTASTTPDLLPGVDLVTEEVEPGVYRVLSDGMEHRLDGAFDRVLVGPGGEIWVREARMRFSDSLWKVGQSEALSAPRGYPPKDQASLFDIDEEGRLVEAYGGGLIVGRNAGSASSAYDLSGRWTPDAVAALGDGTVWASWHSGRDTVRLGKFDDQGWTEYATPDGIESVRDVGYSAGVSAIASTPDGDVWVGIQDRWGAGFEGGALVRFDGEHWTEVQPLGFDAEVRISDVHDLFVAPDGWLWVLAHLAVVDPSDLTPAIGEIVDATGTAQALFRYDGRRWQAFHGHDLLPGIAESELGALHPPIVADEAGRVWASLERLPRGEPTQRSLGETLMSFGRSGTSYLQSIADVNDLALDGHGSIWAATDDGLYVIDPEAMAATE